MKLLEFFQFINKILKKITETLHQRLHIANTYIFSLYSTKRNLISIGARGGGLGAAVLPHQLGRPQKQL